MTSTKYYSKRRNLMIVQKIWNILQIFVKKKSEHIQKFFKIDTTATKIRIILAVSMLMNDHPPFDFK